MSLDFIMQQFRAEMARLLGMSEQEMRTEQNRHQMHEQQEYRKTIDLYVERNTVPAISKPPSNAVSVWKPEPEVDPVVAYRLKGATVTYYTRFGERTAVFRKTAVWQNRHGEYFTVGFFDLVLPDRANRIKETTTYVYTVKNDKLHLVKTFEKRTERL